MYYIEKNKSDGEANAPFAPLKYALAVNLIKKPEL
jgi:hypothetical protein